MARLSEANVQKNKEIETLRIDNERLKKLGNKLHEKCTLLTHESKSVDPYKIFSSVRSVNRSKKEERIRYEHEIMKKRERQMSWK